MKPDGSNMRLNEAQKRELCEKALSNNCDLISST